MQEEIESFIEKNPNWHVEDDKLVARFEFQSFEKIKRLMPGLVEAISKLNHHPEVTFGYKTIEIRTTTHEAGDRITEKDFMLARTCSEIVVGK